MSIPDLDGKPLIKTQSRTSKKSSPIEGIIYNAIRKQLNAKNPLFRSSAAQWNTKLLHTPEAVNSVTFIGIDCPTYQTPTDLRGR